ncbi:uncharacterized protein [Miscanthus floridulus]|uniref:uncharacterized protein n=1 Tax=Miscanthus floridulus TaxID=154761 RepID=UPI00345AED2E
MAHMMTMMNQNQNQNQNQGANQPPTPSRDKRKEFMKGRPPFFSHSTEPLQADDWLKAVERKLNIAQCNDREKVLYGSGQLLGAALDWWDAYSFAQEDPNPITWDQFKEAFRAHHVSAGLIKLKKKEFLALKQDSMTICEYRDKFTQLSRYAPNEVEKDDQKKEHFLEGLNDGL